MLYNQIFRIRFEARVRDAGDHDFSRMNTLGLLSIRDKLLRLRYLVASRGSLHIAAPTGESMEGTVWTGIPTVFFFLNFIA